MYKASLSIIEYIKEKELFRSTAYQDGAKKSIGYGHQIQSTETSLLHTTITKDWAHLQLLKDIQPLENLINNCIKPVLSQSMFDALVDFGYNCGSGSLSKALTIWKNGTKTALTEYIIQFKHYTDSSGKKVVSSHLLARRLDEIDLINEAQSGKMIGVLSLALASLLLIFKRF